MAPACAPTSRSTVDSRTPVHSVWLVSPHTICGRVSGPPRRRFPEHSRKQMRDVAGKRFRSSRVKTVGTVDEPVHEQLVAVGVDGGHPAVVPLEVQVGGGDGAPQVLQGRARRRRAGVAPRVHEGRALAAISLGRGPGRRVVSMACCAAAGTAAAPTAPAAPASTSRRVRPAAPRSRGVCRSFAVRHGSATPCIAVDSKPVLPRQGRRSGAPLRSAADIMTHCRPRSARGGRRANLAVCAVERRGLLRRRLTGIV